MDKTDQQNLIMLFDALLSKVNAIAVVLDDKQKRLYQEQLLKNKEKFLQNFPEASSEENMKVLELIFSPPHQVC